MEFWHKLGNIDVEDLVLSGRLATKVALYQVTVTLRS